ncbi:BTAD domain-containing putative transcriptional regulator [Amycolatopsis rhabdoformis]|uniref:BTAD domain-containing putative transcriptional regulator n=1 Tax=Amycolatopsis rhabdoformis TaxID=1448059 RepID=A0ABZ1I0S4_9PSEU|nr:BTAD domain-containing putative transcriptional regulator [Amycolatopsis rhabdoformis]WSE27408.1 BTAD domain-containing putative transcriptional regulator [Amycolatopsis rhabdoformis]
MTKVRFGLLGAVEAHLDGEPVDLGHARQRWVLAALLADANRPVSTERLVERVWADQPPYRAPRLLASYLSRLRRTLAAADGVGIKHGPSGYVLTAPPESVDVLRFRALVARARERQQPELFDEALALWRDDAFAGLDTPWADAVRDTLAAERLSAQLDRTDLALRLGEHNAVLTAAAQRAAAFPLDERIAGQLMLARYRAGRQAGALEEYDRIRRRLADEFGADPGPALRELHRRILTTDPELSPPRDTPVPRQLPAPPRWFVGRDAELAELDTAMAGGSGTVVISAIGGAGGIGKTSLALRWAHRNVARFPDGQLYVNLRGFDPAGAPLRPEVVVRYFLDALGVAPAAVPAGPEGGFALYRSLVAGRRLLVVLDNARDAAQVEPLLPGSDTCTVLITGRHRLGGLGVRGAQLLDLAQLEEPEARELLTRHLGDRRVAAEPAAVDDLVRWCGGLPLAISVVASRAGATPRFRLEVLARELADASARLDALDAGDLATNVRAVFSWSYAALDAEAQRVFRLLGSVPGPDVSLAGAGALADLARPRAVLRRLVDAHLLQEHLPGRYRMHDLLRLYADELVTASERAGALRRFTDFLLHTAGVANRLLRPERQSIELPESVAPLRLDDRRAATRWFDDEQHTLRATLDSAVQRGAHADVWRLAWCVSGYHVIHGRLAEDLGAWQAGLAAAHALGDLEAQAIAAMYLGTAHTRTGSYLEALRHLRSALSLARQPDLTADASRALGWTLGQSGDFDGALHHTSAALEHYRATGNGLREADALNTLGWYSAQLGRLAEGRAHCERALVLCREHDHRRAETVTLDSLGYIASALGEHEQALAHYRAALALARDTEDAYDEPVILANLGDTHATLGDAAAAREVWARARELFQAHGRTADVERMAAKLTVGEE